MLSSFAPIWAQHFQKKTILVTAASGVAATLINGDTLHKSCFLNNKELNDKVDEFKQVRMIIVDEVSLLSQQTIKLLDNNLRILCSDKNELSRQTVFGGIHIIFSGI